MNNKVVTITPGQVMSLNTGIKDVAGKIDNDEILYIVSSLLDRDDMHSIFQVTRSQWEKLRDLLYPNWHSEDWTVTGDIRTVIAELHDEYMQDVIGQKRLF